MVGGSVAVDFENDIAAHAGELTNRGWIGRPVRADLAAVMGLDIDNVALFNDCTAGAYSEYFTRDLRGGDYGGFFVLSTGLGGRLYDSKGNVISTKPGHKILEKGVVCGCGQDGCIEAHVSGSGIKAKYGMAGEDIPHGDPIWGEVKANLATGMAMNLSEYENKGIKIKVIGFTGSVALKGPHMLTDLRNDLRGQVNHLPIIEKAIHGEESGLYGAMYAVHNRLAVYV